MQISKNFIKVYQIDNYDPLNLLHANVVRAMLKDPEDCIVQLSWIRLQHVMAMSDPQWEINTYIKASTPDSLNGVIKFLYETSDVRNKELRLSR